MVAIRKDYEEHMEPFYENVVQSGRLIVKGESNWDLFEYLGVIYSIPHTGSGAAAGFFVSKKNFKSHLQYLKCVLRFEGLFPNHWKEIDMAFFQSMAMLLIRRP